MKCRSAFTLVELLAVIAIVSILASIVFVGVRSSLLKATDVKCISNLRTLASAYQLFTADNEGLPPPSSYTNSHRLSEGHNGPGIRLLRFYYRDGDHKVWNGGSFLQEPIELCPSVKYNGMTGAANEDNGPDYGLSAYTTGILVNQYFVNPSQTPIIWDSWNAAWNTSRTMPLRHENGIHCAFLDGHVEWMGATDDRLYRTWWYYATKDPLPNSHALSQGTPLGTVTP